MDEQTAPPADKIAPQAEETATPGETTPDAQTEPHVDNANSTEGTTTPAENANPAENAPTAETPTTQPPRNEVESQAAPLPTPDEPSQQFMMKLHIRRRP